MTVMFSLFKLLFQRIFSADYHIVQIIFSNYIVVINWLSYRIGNFYLLQTTHDCNLTKKIRWEKEVYNIERIYKLDRVY